MWAENGVLHTLKALPNSADAAWEFYQQNIKGKECVIHWRMKTHGLIDLINCHPYSVFGDGSIMPMAVMHNGILSTGNKKDVTKSDTWHYVQDYLVPLLEKNPELFTMPQFIDVLEAHIGSGNRFVLLNHLGQMSVINRDSFVEYKGALLSNTYAWDASRGGFGGKTSWNGSSYQWARGGYGASVFDDDAYVPYKPTSHVTAPTTIARDPRYRPDDGIDDDEFKPPTKVQFFSMLKRNNLMQAYKELNMTDVDDCIRVCGEEMWAYFCEIVDTTYITDKDIIEAVLNPDTTLLEMLYKYDGYEDPAYVCETDEPDAGKLCVGLA